MKVKAIEPVGAPGGRQKLLFEDGSSLRIYPAVLAQMSLYPGKELSRTELQELRQLAGAVSAKERAVRIVSATTVSRRELKNRLVQKGESEAHADAAVQWLEELKLVDDREAARQVVQSGLRKGYGEARLRQMLYEKHIPKEYWQEALSQLPAQDDAIDAFLQRRFRGKQPDRAECKRACDALLRRGHRWSDIRSALQRYAPEEEFYED